MAKHTEVTHEVTEHKPFKTTVTDAPDEPEQLELSLRTQMEIAAGKAALDAYKPPPEEPEAEK